MNENTFTVKLYYGNELLGKINTNHSLTIEQAAELLNIDLDETEPGQESPLYDYEQLCLVYPGENEPTTLDELFDALKNRTIEMTSSLPTFGGQETASTIEVWSWDEKRLIIGTCPNDLEIVDRKMTEKSKKTIKKLVCNETEKYTIFSTNVEPWELDEILNAAANELLHREPEHSKKINDYVTIDSKNLKSEIYHALTGLTENTGEYRSFRIENAE